MVVLAVGLFLGTIDIPVLGRASSPHSAAIAEMNARPLHSRLFSDFEEVTLLGKGAYGEVFKVTTTLHCTMMCNLQSAGLCTPFVYDICMFILVLCSSLISFGGIVGSTFWVCSFLKLYFTTFGNSVPDYTTQIQLRPYINFRHLQGLLHT